MNLTKRSIEALPTPAKRAFHYDDQVRGLLVKVEPSGAKSFAWYRSVRCKPVWRVIGEFPALSVEQAREQAEKNNTAAAKWKSDRYEGPSPFEQEIRRHLTLKEALDEYVEGHLKAHAKNPTRAVYDAKWAFGKYVPKDFSSRTLASITRNDIRHLHNKVGEENGHYVANRLLELLSAIFNFAIDKAESFAGVNPCRKIVKFHETKRSVFITKADLPKFLDTLRAEKKDNRNLHDCVWLALLCGIRRGDLFSVRWEHLDLNGGTWFVPDPKSQEPYTVALSPEAIEVFKSRRGLSDSEFVFPSDSESGHIEDLKKTWNEFRKKAGFPTLRFHDLRRTFASHAIQNNVPLLTVSKMLGHASGARVTEVYAHLTPDNVRQGVTTATQAMLTAKAD